MRYQLGFCTGCLQAAAKRGGWLGGDKELEEEGRKEDLFGGPVGMRDKQKEGRGTFGGMCAAASNKPSIGGGAGRKKIIGMGQ